MSNPTYIESRMFKLVGKLHALQEEIEELIRTTESISDTTKKLASIDGLHVENIEELRAVKIGRLYVTDLQALYR